MHPASEDESALPAIAVNRRTAMQRLLVGLLQGALLYLLYATGKDTLWPASNGYLFSPLLLAALFLPLLFVSGLGHLSRRVLSLWLIAALAVCLLFGWYDIWRMDFAGAIQSRTGFAHFLPSPFLPLTMAAGFFIAHTLVMASAQDRKRIASYATYFELAWKLAIQLLFSALFVGVLFLILWLGSALFMLVRLNFLRNLLSESWFVIPVLAVALSAALHVTDVRPRIVQSIRSLLLALMSWLLPIALVIVGGFLASLPIVGLDPLWATRHATSVLLTSAALLVLLINAAFQSGQEASHTARILRIAARIACVLLMPLVLIAVYALTLRVQQYGWTVDRIIAAACLLIAACHATGYLWAALDKRSWLAPIAHVNIATAIVMLAVLLALFTPVADPIRLSVADQVARLEAGKTDAANFDYHYLRFEGERYGNAVLHRMQTDTGSPQADISRERAAIMLDKTNRWEREDTRPVANADSRTANIRLKSADKSLPADFLQQNWHDAQPAYALPECLRYREKSCDAYLIDVNRDGHEDILLRGENRNQLALFVRNGEGIWQAIGFISIDFRCRALMQQLDQGALSTLPPQYDDLQIDGTRLRLQFWADEPTCPP